MTLPAKVTILKWIENSRTCTRAFDALENEKYNIYETLAGEFDLFNEKEIGGFINDFNSLDEAKEGAQRDFEETLQWQYENIMNNLETI
jgi:hypothetical protein